MIHSKKKRKQYFYLVITYGIIALNHAYTTPKVEVPN